MRLEIVGDKWQIETNRGKDERLRVSPKAECHEDSVTKKSEGTLVTGDTWGRGQGR